jgi:hypothetical protein
MTPGPEAVRVEGMATSLGTGSAARPSAPASGLSIRMAGIEDIPAVARITQEGPLRTDADPEVAARATRLLLTHVAFERGALWVEHATDGRIARAVAVVPGARLSPWEPVGRVVAPDLARLAPLHAPGPEVGRVFRTELAAVAPSWVLGEISKSALTQPGHPALLEAALRWGRAQPARERGPIAVVADTESEREAAESLGFVERWAGGLHPGWWLGVEGGSAATGHG